MNPELINSVAQIKKAAAITNCEVGELERTIASAIVRACDEIIDGKLAALKSGKSVKELILEKGLLSEEKLYEILDPYSMTEPGIRGKNPADVLI